MIKFTLRGLVVVCLAVCCITGIMTASHVHAAPVHKHVVKTFHMIKVKASTGKGVVPHNTVHGDCGDATLIIGDEEDGGDASFTMRITSAPQSLNQVYYSLSWQNTSVNPNTYGNHQDTVAASGNAWTTTITDTTGTGDIKATAYYAALLADGSTCYSSPDPEDEQTIS